MLGGRDSDSIAGVMGSFFETDDDEIRRRDGGSDGLCRVPDYERQAFFRFLFLSSLLGFFSSLVGKPWKIA